MKKQLEHLKNYHRECVASGAYIGGLFLISITIFGVLIYQTM